MRNILRVINLYETTRKVIYLHQLIRLTLSLYSTDDADKDAFGMLQVYIHNELKPLLNNLFEQRKNSMFLSIVGYNTNSPSPTFQLLVKVSFFFLAPLWSIQVGFLNSRH